jgi:sugar/nucleoside kinase (ribokinase family)
VAYSIGLKYTFVKGDRESQIVINPAHIAHAAYRPAYDAEINDTSQHIEQSLKLHFTGADPLELNGPAADEVWKELKKTLPDYMRIPLERDSD